MSYRVAQIESLGLGARWLSPERSKNAYVFALPYTHSKRYGLNEDTVEDIQRLEISDHGYAKRWLSDRLLAEGTVQVVFGDDEVFVVDAAKFIEHWHQIFVPSRDDAVILHNLNNQVLFYCHKEELEFGCRISPTIHSTRTR
jgi:hypothetical protein